MTIELAGAHIYYCTVKEYSGLSWDFFFFAHHEKILSLLGNFYLQFCFSYDADYVYVYICIICRHYFCDLCCISCPNLLENKFHEIILGYIRMHRLASAKFSVAKIMSLNLYIVDRCVSTYNNKNCAKEIKLMM